MICPNCGEKADAAAKFCSKCGQALEMESVKATHDGILNGRIVSLAVHLKVGIIKREPWVLWIGPQQCAFICIGQKRYDVIVSTGTQGAGNLPKDKAKAAGQAFRSYAQSLVTDSLETILQTHPGSVAFSTKQIKHLQIVATYDSELHTYDDYERFILELPKDKYRGAIERDTNLSGIVQILEGWLGDRYQYRTMDGFPFL